VIVARDGEGDMAVSNAIGSNVFDIFMGLGLPYFLGCTIYNRTIPVDTGGIEISMAILLSVVIVTVIAVASQGWVLYRQVGAFLLLCYVTYVVWAYMDQLEVL